MNDPANPYSLRENGISICREDDNGNLYAAPLSHGLCYYEALSGRFYYTDIANENMAEANITDMLADKAGKFWLTCSNNGLFTFDPPKKKMESVRRGTASLKSNYAAGFCLTAKNNLLVYGTNGVYSFNKAENNLTPIELFEKSQNLFSDNKTWTVKEDSQNKLWFCTYNGLVCYNPLTKKQRVYRHKEAEPGSISSSQTVSITEDNRQRQWVTTFGAGLNMLDPATGKFNVYRANDNTKRIPTNYLTSVFKDAKGIIYIGSWNGGLIRLNPETLSFETFRHDATNKNSISFDNCNPFFEDKNGFIWIGTTGGGLNVFDPVSKKFRAFTMNDGLPSDAVISLINDDDGKMWAGTNKGLTQFTLPITPFAKNCKIDFRNYNAGDGLPSEDLLFGGAIKDPDGTIFFSTSNAGFFYFNPRKWEDNNFMPPVYITGMSLLNQPQFFSKNEGLLKMPIEYAKEVILDYRQNIISFSFAALNYIHPEKNNYAYKLEGYDKDWIYTDASRRFASYTNLDPGSYTFMVKASNNDNKWNDKLATIIVTITPPFWQTWWFRLLSIFVLIGLVLIFYRYRIRQLMMLQNVRNRIAADLHDDIGSTLNSISVFSEVARIDEEKREHALTMIGESSRKIVDSLSDIVWSINPENDSFDKILFRMRSISYNLLKAKNIECVFSADESLAAIKLPMEIRRNFYLIFKEALNNLVKYSHATQASILISREHGSITFLVRDDGVGFDIRKEYSGNGLNNMQNRADEINALLSIESGPGRGTSVQLNLKI